MRILWGILENVDIVDRFVDCLILACLDWEIWVWIKVFGEWGCEFRGFWWIWVSDIKKSSQYMNKLAMANRQKIDPRFG